MPEGRLRPIGVIIANLGTPDAPVPEAVGRYLREFLMDPWVVDLPRPLRWFLVNVLIVPRRKKASAELYRKIWTEDGSPLLLNTRKLTRQVSGELGSRYRVKMAMRYGRPSFAEAFAELKAEGVGEIVVSPQYPQYALSTYESTRKQAASVARALLPAARLRFVPPFFAEPAFLEAHVARLKDVERTHQPEHYLFSFHGLPTRHLKKTDPSAHCFRNGNCCGEIGAVNRDCYRAQCFETARALALRMGIPAAEYSVGFQSRMPGSRWIAPYSDHLVRELRARGIRRLAVACPSFTADCLETLEEVGIRYRSEFKRLGGEELYLVPSLNAGGTWARAVSEMVRRAGEIAT